MKSDERLIEFYRARDEAARLQQAYPVFRWVLGDDAVTWRVGDEERRWGHRPDAEPTPAAEPPDGRRAFMRETYLVPEWPMPEAASPDKKRFASVQGGEICVRHADTDAAQPLTIGATSERGWDLETVGVCPWSPDGRWLFANAVDRSAVEPVVRTRFDAHGAVWVDWPRNQRAGKPIERMLPHLVPTDGGPPRPLLPDWTQDEFVRLVGWLPEGDTVVFARFSRLLDQVDLLVGGIDGQRARPFLNERSVTFLRPSTIVWTAPVGCWLLDGRRFLWLSERDNWAHLYLGSLDREGLTRLTSGRIAVHDVLHHDGDHVWFTASSDGPRPYDRHLFRVALRGGEPVRLTEGEGEHAITFAPGGTQFVDVRSTPEKPPEALLRAADGNVIVTLDVRGPATAAGDGMGEELSFLAADGETTICGVLYRPRPAEPRARHPLIHWVYGGPQLTATPRRFGPSNVNEQLLHALARLGYAVLVVDGRGTPGRSKAFQDVAWRSFAPHVVADQVGALRQLLDREPWLDRKRVGVMGRSWGAHFALRMMAAASDLYRAGVLVVPGLDPYGGLIYEPYLGLPQTNPEPYRAAEPWALPATLAKTARLLLIAGTLDSPCAWDAQRLSSLLVEADIGHHVITFAEQEHVFEGAAARFHDRSAFEFFEAALS